MEQLAQEAFIRGGSVLYVREEQPEGVATETYSPLTGLHSTLVR